MAVAQRQKTRPDEWDAERLRMAHLAAGHLLFDWDLRTNEITWLGDVAIALGFADAPALCDAQSWQEQVAPDDRPQRGLALAQQIEGGCRYELIYKLRRPDGQIEWVEERGMPSDGVDGRPVRVIGTLRVITEARVSEERLARLAYRDEMTGLLNRVRLREQVEEALSHIHTDGLPASYLLVNIDNLGMLNDAYGFDIADAVILELSRRIGRTLRQGDVLARVGGNQFGVLLSNCGRTQLLAAADRILTAVRARLVETSGGPLAVSVSIGAVPLLEGVATHQAVFGRAEEALEQAKRAGRDRAVCYDVQPETIERRRDTLATGDKVFRALRERRLRLAFQPIVRAESGQPFMYECLLRMLGETGKVVAAGDFIPAAEKLGLIRMVDRRTLELALEELDACPDLHLAVNLSGMTVVDPSTLTQLLGLVKDSGRAAERLTFEITETVAVQDIADSVHMVERLKELGCRVALDDFGAGYTSYRYLKTLDLDIVKIDGQFVQGLDANRDNDLFVRTLIDLAHGFGVRVVAESIETENDALALRRRGVDYLQGYYFGRPEMGRLWQAVVAPNALAALGGD